MVYFLSNRDEAKAHVFSSYQRDRKVNRDESGCENVEKHNISSWFLNISAAENLNFRIAENGKMVNKFNVTLMVSHSNKA